MNPDTIKAFLLYSLAFNYGGLIIWSGVFILARDWMYRFHSQWFKLSVDTFDALHYAGMAVYKNWNLPFESRTAHRALAYLLEQVLGCRLLTSYQQGYKHTAYTRS